MKTLDNDIKELLEKELESTMKKEVNKIYNDVVAHAVYAITQFYEAYTPKQYVRTYSFMDTPIVELTRQNPTSYFIDIKFILPEPVHKDVLGEEYIYENVIMRGIHGTPRIAVTTSPASFMDAYLNKHFR